MKILHVIADLALETGGPTQVCIEMAKMMARRGHEVRIVTTDQGLPPNFRDVAPWSGGGGNLTIEAFPRNPPRFFGTSWALRRRLSETIPDADIVHIHSLYRFHGWVASVLCRRFGKPYIVQPHGTLDPYHYARHRWRKIIIEALFENAVQKHAAGLLYTMADERDLARPVAGNPAGWVVSIGIDLSPLADLPPPAALRARYPQIGDRKVVLFFGRLNFKKGLDTTIKAFAEIARDRNDIFLLIAGPDGGLRQSAEQWVIDAGLADRTVFTGMVSGEDKRIVLGGSDIFVLPSLSENFGIAVVEAAACGMPVIISDRVNLWHDFDAARAALVGSPTVDDFVIHLRTVLDQPNEAAAMATRGADLVRQRFTWEALGTEYEAMYREASASRTLDAAGHVDQAVAVAGAITEPKKGK